MVKASLEETKELWILQNKLICLCRGIPRKRFVDAIKLGASSIPKVNRILGSGGGDCEGTRCGPVIEQLLRDYKNGVSI